MPVRPSRARRIAGHVAKVVLGVVLGAAIAEGAFHVRDHGAFPHLNVYQADPKLGVRLRPGAEERVAFGGNAVTSVRIGAAGFRGDVAAPNGNDEILVVGDSQVFGLGVEESETFSARLAVKRKQTVINAGIPTYGPLEYQAVLEQWVPKRRPKIVIYVINLANDLTEARRPNVARHVVWDGWAVRKETAPSAVTSFPGRELLFRKSHGVFAFRRWYHGSSAADERPLASEGSWKDLVDAANASNRARESAEQEALDEWLLAMQRAASDAEQTQAKLQVTASSAYPDVFDDEAGKAYLKTNGHPGDIVSERVYLSEAAEGPARRVRTVLQGAAVRAQIEESLKQRAAAEIDRQESKAILARFEDRAAIEKRIAELRALPARLARAYSPMAGPLELAQSLCRANGARLLVVVLPMDVQVSAEEWKKYKETPIDMAAARILVDDVVHAATGVSAIALDPTSALAAAEPGAFLHADLHMSVKGHQALADAIDAKLAEPPPLAPITVAAPAIGYGKVCACQKTAHPEAGCASLPPKPDVDCLRTYSGAAEDCAKLLACVRGETSAPPKCLGGWVNGGEKRRCVQSCAADEPCNAGTKCTVQAGGAVCL